MEFRTLGFTGEKISVVGLGTWAIGGSGWAYAWGPQDDEESIATIHSALDNGVNWVDTAPVYGFGHSEEVVGRAVKDLRERPFIATKVGRRWNEEGKIYGDLSRQNVRSEVEVSLRRLQVDVIDLLQIHWPNPDSDIEEGWSAIAELIAEGKVRFGGVSNFSIDQLQRILPIHPVASLQPPYSMLRRDIENGLLQFCHEHQIGVIAYSPMQKGLLTGRMTRERIQSLPDDDHRKRDKMFLEPDLDKNLLLVDLLRPIAERKGMTLAQLAILWTLRRPEVTSAIVGGRKPAQVEETVRAGEFRFDPGDVEEIETLLQQRLGSLEHG
jgi:aryl-alcohol dehydrogenase-like predicted oxidoreductase